MNELKLKAMAKINLALDVVGKRENGYHDVRMIMQTVDLYDTLIFRKTEEPGVRISTNRKEIPAGEDNLICRAAKLLMEEYQLREGLWVNLEKHIPVAAGMAGGSADAAATLTAMDKMFGLSMAEADKLKVAVRVGADVPYCMLGGTALAEGIGEMLTPLPPAPACYVLIAKPDIEISTGEVYQSFRMENAGHRPNIDGMVQAVWNQNLEGILDGMANVLESVTAVKYPVIEQIKDFMRRNGAEEAMMSGSGPSVFGLYKDAAAAAAAYEELLHAGYAKQAFVTRFTDKTCVEA